MVGGNMSKQQLSKRSRKIRKEARKAKLSGNFSHPSHVSGTRRSIKHIKKKIDHKEFEKEKKRFEEE
ncbi:MAG: hypothetical protein ACOCP4_01445 [Candidatus Woesearchaeota archaeon]